MESNQIRVLLGICVLLFSTAFSAQEHDHDHGEKEFTKKEENIPEYYKGIEVFEAEGKYRVILKRSGEAAALAKKELAVLHKQFTDSTYRLKPKSDLNDLYLKLAEILPAGTVFRVKSANDVEDGHVELRIETKEPLNKKQLEAKAEIQTVSDEPIRLSFDPVYTEPDSSTLSLPDNYTKDTGYSEIVNRLSAGAGVVKTSVVFSNPGNVRTNLMSQPYYQTVMALSKNRKGELFGIGFNDNELTWWTQYLTLEQAQALYENPLVINLVPRQE